MHLNSVVWVWVHRLASLKLTALLLVVLVGAVWAAYQLAWEGKQAGAAFWVLGPVLAALTLNLAAAILANPRFRRQSSLLIFHLCLLAIVLLVGWGRLTFLKGWVEVTEGGDFDGELVGVEAGPLHPWHLQGLRFTNDNFRIEYDAGPKRGHTYNQVSWVDDNGPQQAVIGDQQPLVLEGYRFYTSFNKGFAPSFLWRLSGTGEVVQGSVHLPSYPGNSFSQALDWALPGTDRRLWIKLDFDEVILDPDKPSLFRPPHQHRLIVREGGEAAGERHVLQPGETLELPEGSLHYLGLRTWMGYTVYYDETRYWLLAACVLAVISIGWFFWEKYARVPWQHDSQGG